MKQRVKKTEFKKIDQSPSKSVITPTDAVKVEKEVLEAVEEAKEEAKEEEKELEHVEVALHGQKFSIGLVEEEEKEKLSDEARGNLDKLLEGSWPKPEEKKPEEKKPADGRMLRRMRLRDRSFNKTCSRCLRRVSLENMEDGKSEICDDCK